MAAKPEQAFVPFSWLDDPQASENAFLENTHDVAKGIALALDLLHSCALADDNGNDPILASDGRETLMLFAKAAARMLRDRVEDHIDAANSRAAAASKVTS